MLILIIMLGKGRVILYGFIRILLIRSGIHVINLRLIMIIIIDVLVRILVRLLIILMQVGKMKNF